MLCKTWISASQLCSLWLGQGDRPISTSSERSTRASKQAFNPLKRSMERINKILKVGAEHIILSSKRYYKFFEAGAAQAKICKIGTSKQNLDENGAPDPEANGLHTLEWSNKMLKPGAEIQNLWGRIEANKNLNCSEPKREQLSSGSHYFSRGNGSFGVK